MERGNFSDEVGQTESKALRLSFSRSASGFWIIDQGGSFQVRASRAFIKAAFVRIGLNGSET